MCSLLSVSLSAGMLDFPVSSLQKPCPLAIFAGFISISNSYRVVTQFSLFSHNSFCNSNCLTTRNENITFVCVFKRKGLKCFTDLYTTNAYFSTSE